jgi:hypothetical protein
MATSNSVQAIEQAIAKLTAAELYELNSWLDKRPHPIDARLSAGLAAGHFDKAIFRALEDESHDRVQPL